MSKKSDISELIKEVEEISNEINSNETDRIYGTAAKAILVTNYFLFLAVIWKSFDLDGAIPFLAKLSIVLFGLGLLFSCLRYLADFLGSGVENYSSYKKLMLIYQNHGDVIKEHDLEAYHSLKFTNGGFLWAAKIAKTDDLPEFIFTLFYYFTGLTATLISFALLFIGLVFLTLGAII